MVRTQRAPRISLTLLLTVMAVILGLTMVVTPLEPLTRLALLISPRDILEPKTILLLVWLKRALPLLSVATLLWLFAPRPVQISARRWAARLLHNPVMSSDYPGGWRKARRVAHIDYLRTYLEYVESTGHEAPGIHS